MGRCRNVQWPTMLLVLVLGIFAGMLVWLVRALVRLNERPAEDTQNIWCWDWYDVFFFSLLFILVVMVGVVVSCKLKQRSIYVTTEIPASLSSPQTPASLVTAKP